MSDDNFINVMVVDDHPLMRSGIIGEINSQRDMRVVAEASDGMEAIAAYKRHRPDVTLMDIRMPGMSGIDAITEIRSTFPSSKFIILTSSAGDVQVMKAFAAGATGYLLKNLLRTELIDTIRLVKAGKRKIPPDIAQQIAEHALDDSITARELEVLRGIANGRSNKLIADTLSISEHTVKNHIKSILSKLNANDRTDAVVIAIRRGYLEM